LRENEVETENHDSHSNHNGENIEEQLDFLRKVVAEFQNSGEPEEELLQAGYIGLLNAVNLYQKEQAITFQEYARYLISGEIRHYIREKHRKTKVPDWLSLMMNKLLNQMLTSYRKQFNKFPDLNELSEMLGLSPEILKEALKAREAVQEVSIDQKRRNEVDIKEPIDFDKIKKEMKQRKYGR
jgi:RNA polymerase sigma-B factor